MTLRERMKVRRVTEGMIQQLQIGNNSAVTWVPGTRAAKLRYGRAWVKVILGRQSLRLSWGRSTAHVDKTGDA